MLLTDGDEADGWLGFLSPAAALWLVAAMFAAGGGRPDRWQQRIAILHGPVRISLGVLGAILAVGLANRLVRPWLAEFWLGLRLERPLERVQRRRRERWEKADKAAGEGTTSEQLRQAAIRTRIALARPESATWMGDRAAALETRVRNQYGLDLPSAWPRLWLLLPDVRRTELRTSVRAWHHSTAWAVWALLYALLALAWHPLLALAVLTFAAALSSARRAVANVTDLAEAAVDLYVVELAEQLGITVPNRRMTLDIGREINVRLRK